MTAAQRNEIYFERIHPQLLELGAQICNADVAGDGVLDARAREQLTELYQKEAARGFWHPHLTESMGDFCESNSDSVAYYRKALEEAKALELATHSILISMARSLLEIGEFRQFQTCIEEARLSAKLYQDDEAIAEIDNLQAEFTSR